MRGRKITFALLALGLCSLLQAALAGDVETSVAVRLDVGHDANPLRMAGAGPGAGYTQLSFDAGVERAYAAGFALFLDAAGARRIHASDGADADFTSGDLRAGVSLSGIDLGRGRLSVAFGGATKLRRNTYTDRRTGAPYRVAGTAPGEVVSIADRFDSDVVGLFLEARYRVNRDLLLFADTTLDDVGYREDYTTNTGLDPLDHRVLTVEPGLRYRVHRKVIVDLSLEASEVVYDDRPALDGTGDAVAGTLREYDYVNWKLSTSFRPSDTWRLRFGLRGGGRDDVYAGYYDYDTRAEWLSLERKLGTRNSIRLYGSRRDLDYRRATVDGTENGEVLGSEVTRWIGRFERRFERGLRWYAESGTQQTDSRDPVYAYDRDWFMTGIEYRR